MKTTKQFVLTYILFFLSAGLRANIFAQPVDTIKDFKLYTVHNSKMQMIMDEIVDIANSCPYFSIMKKQYFIYMQIDTSTCSCWILPQNLTNIYFFRTDPYFQDEAVCIYRNQIFYIQDFSNTKLAKNFYFNDQDTVIDIYFQHNENISEHIFPPNNFAEIFYQIKDGVFIRDIDDEDSESFCNLNGRGEFIYQVRIGDTWETIAEKCACSAEQLMREFPEFNTPVPGVILIVNYQYDNNGIFIGMKRLFSYN